MLSGAVSVVGLGMGALDGVNDRQRGRGSLGNKSRASRFNQWAHCCVVVRERRALPKLL